MIIKILTTKRTVNHLIIKFKKTSKIMNIYQDYIQEIEERKAQGLHPKPIDSAELLSAIIEQIKDTANDTELILLTFFIYNTFTGHN